MATLLISTAANLALGFALNLLFRPDQPNITQEGPRLSDLKISTSSYGVALPKHRGTVRTSVNYLWAPDIDEVVNVDKTEGGGKGGGGGGSVTTTTYTYFADFAASFGQGVAKDVLKIWANSKLIYDKTDTSLTNGKYKFRFYKGDETQLPDPLMEAREGAGNVEPYRGTCYLVAEQWPLADFGNGRPNVTALIAYEATDVAPFTSLVELPLAEVPIENDQFIQLDPFTDDFYTFADLGTIGIARSSLSSMVMQAGSFGPFEGHSSVFGADGKVYSQRNSSSNWTSLYQRDPVSFEILRTYGGDGPTCTFTNDGCMPNGSQLGVLQVGDDSSGQTRDFVIVAADAPITVGGIKILQEVGAFFSQVFVDTTTGLGGSPSVIQDPFNRRAWVVQNDVTQAVLYEVNIPANFDEGGLAVGPITLDLVGTYLKNGSQLSGTAPASGNCVLPNENALILSNGTSMIKVDLDDGSVLVNNTSLGFTSRNQWATDGIFAFPRNGSSQDLVTIDTESLVEVASQNVTLTGLPGFLANARAAYDPRSHSIVYARVNAGSDRVVRVFLDRRTGDAEPLADVVADLFNDVGITPTELDLTALAGLTVRGYSVTRQTTLRAALEPLQTAFLFDIIESDFKLKAVLRGGAVTAAIPNDELGLITGREDDLEFETRRQESELPLSVVVKYIDIDTDYQDGAQVDRRVRNPAPTQGAVSPLTLELPIVFNASEGKQLAQKVLYTAWAERVRIQSSLTWKYLRLDPADVLELTVGDEIRRVRLVDVEVGANLEIQFNALQEDARTAQSTLVGDKGGFIRKPVPSLLPTRFLPLDLPLLSANDASFQNFVRAYYAFAAFEDGWNGAILYQSRDAGATFTEISAASVESAYGVTKAAIANPGSVTTWDETSSITLSVQRGIDRFVTSTDAEVLNGANAIAVLGNNGPEIIQFVDVVQTDASTVVLSRLLRGRRGTEPNATGHVIGERFVLLESGRVFRFDLPLALRNTLLQYRAVSLGTALEDAEPSFQAYVGEDLKPYSVVHLAATRPGGTDFAATWVRRTRFNGELLDGTGTVPLNEDTEEYDVETLLNDAVVDNKTVTTPAYSLTNVEFLAAGFVDAQFGWSNADFETSAGWALTSAALYVTAVGSILPQSGTRMVYFGNGAIAQEERMLDQTVTLASLGYPVNEWDIQATRPQFTLRYYENAETGVAADTVRVDVEFLSAGFAVLGTLADPAHVPAANSWVERNGGTAGVPVGTRFVRIRFYGNRGGGLAPCNIMVDNVRCSIDTGIPPLTVRVWQKSALVGRGRLAQEIL